MGGWFSREPTEEEVAAQVAALPPPKYKDTLWISSCRPVSSLKAFTPYTLLFKPDCRLFCANGMDCKLLNVAQHRELFIHTTVHAVRAAAAASPPTAVLNQEACPSLAVPTLPHVPACLACGEDQTPMLPAELHGRRIVVWVHGFRQRYFRVVGVASHLEHRLTQVARQSARRDDDDDAVSATDRAALPVVVLAFLWPCHARKTAYGLARADAMRAAPRLRELLAALHAAGCAVSVVGHSMGCRVALQALLRPEPAAAGGTAAVFPPQCAVLHLVGAAVDREALCEGGEFERARLCAATVRVYCSLHDEVLRQHFRLGEALSGGSPHADALGLAQPPGGIRGVEVVDVSASVAGHNPNLWLLSARVTEDIHAGARGVAPAVATPAAAEPEPEAEEEGNCFGASLAQEESSDESSDEDDARDESELQHKLAMSLGYSSAPTPKQQLSDLQKAFL